MPRRKPEKPAGMKSRKKFDLYRDLQNIKGPGLTSNAFEPTKKPNAITLIGRGPLTDEDADQMIDTVETVDDDEAEQ